MTLRQTAVGGSLASGPGQANRHATAWRRQAEFASRLGGTEFFGEWRWPVCGRLTARYGDSAIARCPHSDIHGAGALGTPVVAAGDGAATAEGWEPDGYGHVVIFAHAGGCQTLEMHLQPPGGNRSRLHRNDGVRRGDPIGGLRGVGSSTGPNFLFEMWLDGRGADFGQVLWREVERSRTRSRRLDAWHGRSWTHGGTTPNGPTVVATEGPWLERQGRRKAPRR